MAVYIKILEDEWPYWWPWAMDSWRRRNAARDEAIKQQKIDRAASLAVHEAMFPEPADIALWSLEDCK